MSPATTSFLIHEYLFIAQWGPEGLQALGFCEKNEGIKEPEKVDSTTEERSNRLKAELNDWFNADLDRFSIPLAPKGTAFQKSVWKALLTIPSGSHIGYRELAFRAGHPQALRAAAQACGANPILILIPCHRVLRSDGSLGGYSAGIAHKKAFLAIEERRRTAYHGPVELTGWTGGAP